MKNKQNQKPRSRGRRSLEWSHVFRQNIGSYGIVAPSCRFVSIVDLKALISTYLGSSNGQQVVIDSATAHCSFGTGWVMEAPTPVSGWEKQPTLQYVVLAAENGATIGGTSSLETLEQVIAQTVNKPADVMQRTKVLMAEKSVTNLSPLTYLARLFRKRTTLDLTRALVAASNMDKSIQSAQPEVRLMILTRNNQFDSDVDVEVTVKYHYETPSFKPFSG